MQTSLFEFEDDVAVAERPDISEWGTFKDSLRAPVHGWFTYPAGFSYKAVEHSLKNANLTPGIHTIYDPFMGSGTTNLVAKSLGFDSIGVEAHPFVFDITRTKMNWDLRMDDIVQAIRQLEFLRSENAAPENLEEFLRNEFPELILKCFLPETLFELWAIREAIPKLSCRPEVREFLRTALVCVLRDVSIAATGWPYIAPNKVKITSMSKKGWETYKNRALKMVGDLAEIKKRAVRPNSDHQIFNGDSRNTFSFIESDSADHIFTSPPYLNNFDYADRTRLEMYFTGAAKNWGEISDKIRTKLMTSATTQISRTDPRYQFSPAFKYECPEVHGFLADAVAKLDILRHQKGGKKSYDLMTVGYFNDIYQILKDNFRILKKGSKALYILGDSAPYGVHIPTDELIGQIGVAIGFEDYQIQILRERGGKWEKNPQRHSVMLRESVVVLSK